MKRGGNWLLGVVVVLALFAALAWGAVAAKAEGPEGSAGSHAPTLFWEVEFGLPTHGGLYNDTRWFLGGKEGTVFATTYLRWGSQPGLLFPITPTGIERWFAGPPYAYEATGFQLATAEGQPSFAGMRWSSGQCLPGPKLTITREDKKDRIQIVNTSATLLFVANGDKVRFLSVGETFNLVAKNSGSLIVTTAAAEECAALWWRR